MFLRVIGESFLKQTRRKLVALAAVTLGTATAAALANMALDVGDRMSLELRAFGANLVVQPAGGGSRVVLGGEDLTGLRERVFLSEEDVVRVKQNFWSNNILAFSPVLDAAGEVEGRRSLLRGVWFEREVPLEDGRAVTAGVRGLYPFWTVAGSWPAGSAGAPGEGCEGLAGAGLARALGLRPGRTVEVAVGGRSRQVSLCGVLTTGGEEDDALLLPVETVQRLAGLEGRVDRVLVSALTTPENAVYERLGASPRDIPPEEFESWSCTPFVSSIAWELSRAVPGAEALPIRRVADSEGRVLRKIGGLMGLLALLASAGAALTVTSALTTGVLERRAEIGLLKALGAGGARVVSIFLAEAAVVGLLGGAAGGALGLLLSRHLSLSVFGVPGSVRPLAALLAMAAALLITLAGCAVPARRIARLRAAEALRA